MKKYSAKRVLIALFFIGTAVLSFSQSPKTTELVMSMSQRSLVMPGYLTELKALIAKQAYNFWVTGNTEPYVSHLNIYSSLHEANKYLGFDSARMLTYNQSGFHSNKVTAVRFAPESGKYFSASADGTVLQWDLENPKALPTTIFQSEKIIKSLDVANNGKWMLVEFYKAGLALVSLDKSQSADFAFIEDPEPIQTAVLMPDEQQYVSITKSGDLKIKDFRNESRKIGTTSSKVKAIKVDGNQGTIYAGTSQGILETWSKPYGTLDSIENAWQEQNYFGYRLGTFAINCLDISSDGKYMAIGRERGDVILWNIMEKRLERIISSHQSAITDINFHPKKNLLLTTSRDRTARLWDLDDSRKLPIILDDHEDWVLTGSFDPSGEQIITGCADMFLRTWPVDPKQLADRVCDLVDRNMTPAEWKEFVGADIPYEKTCPNLD